MVAVQVVQAGPAIKAGPIDASYVQGLLRQRLTEALVNAIAWVIRYKEAEIRKEGFSHPDCSSPPLLARLLVDWKFQEMDELMRSPNMDKLLPHILWARNYILGAKRSSVGNELYPQIQSALMESAPFRADVGFVGAHFNAGKITGMLLHDIEEAEELCRPEMQGKLAERIMEACDVLKEHFKAV